MVITETMVVSVVGQLAVLYKRWQNHDIGYDELRNYGAKKIANICGLSRYKTLYILEECVKRGYVMVDSKIHRKWHDDNGNLQYINKDVFVITDKGLKKVRSWVSLGKYRDCIELIYSWHNENRKLNLRKRIKRQQIIFGNNSMFRDIETNVAESSSGFYYCSNCDESMPCGCSKPQAVRIPY